MDKKMFLITMMGFGLFACRETSPDESHVQTFSIPGSIAQRLELGQAYDSHRAKHGNLACVQGEVRSELLDGRSRIEYSRDMSYEKMMKSISGELAAGVSFPSISVDAKADYASQNSSSEYRETHSLMFRYTAKEKFKLGSVVLSPKGKEMAKAGGDKARDRCKNEFINEIDVGGIFTANLSIEFKNRTDKDKFGGSLKIDVLGGTVKVEGALQEADESSKQSIRIRLAALQEGGDPLMLATVFSPDLASCNANELGPCIAAFRQLIEYGKTLEQQMRDRNSLVVLGYQTESYEDTGLDELLPAIIPMIDPVVEQTRSEIERQLEEARAQESRIDFLLTTFAAVLAPSRMQALRDAHETINRNQSLLAQDLNVCYQYPYAGSGDAGALSRPCLARYEKDRPLLLPIDPSLLDLAELPAKSGV